jgi:hypothetical protein
VATSVMEKDIGPHEHDVRIYVSYEVYAVCVKCGMHDWSVPETEQDIIEYYKEKYPKHSVVQL